MALPWEMFNNMFVERVRKILWRLKSSDVTEILYGLSIKISTANNSSSVMSSPVIWLRVGSIAMTVPFEPTGNWNNQFSLNKLVFNQEQIFCLLDSHCERQQHDPVAYMRHPGMAQQIHYSSPECRAFAISIWAGEPSLRLSTLSAQKSGQI